jgi:hypothetical protein
MAFVRYRGEIVHRKIDRYGDRGQYKGEITIYSPTTHNVRTQHSKNLTTVETLFDTNKRRLAAELNRRGKEIVILDRECAGVENTYLPIRI